MSEVNTSAASLKDMLAELAKLQAERRAMAANAPVVVADVRRRDAFGSPIGDGTNRLHVVLAEAYAQGAWLDRKAMIALAQYGNTPNHLNTMRGKGRVVSGERGMWRLSDAAAALWHGEGKPFGFATAAPSPTPEVPADANVGDENAPAKKARKRKAKAAEVAEGEVIEQPADENTPTADTGEQQ